ncbi:MAG: hypothetical protein ACOYKE_08925 [Ferruginibacter sp.]
MTIPASNNKKLLLIIAVLFLSNLILIYFLWMQPQANKRNRSGGKFAMVREALINEVHFNTAQLATYDSLNELHRKSMQQFMDSGKQLKAQQYKNLVDDDFSDSILQQSIQTLANTFGTMEHQQFSHLRKVRSICTPTQLPVFDSLQIQILIKKNNKGHGR